MFPGDTGHQSPGQDARSEPLQEHPSRQRPEERATVSHRDDTTAKVSRERAKMGQTSKGTQKKINDEINN